MGIVYVGSLGVVLYALYKERQALGCRLIPDGSDCDNARGKAVKGSHPKPGDSPEKLKERIKHAASFSDRWVVWRISILLGYAATFAIYFITFNRIPTERELLISWIIIGVLLYFTFNFYGFHLFRHVHDAIVRCLSKLDGDRV